MYCMLKQPVSLKQINWNQINVLARLIINTKKKKKKKTSGIANPGLASLSDLRTEQVKQLDNKQLYINYNFQQNDAES